MLSEVDWKSVVEMVFKHKEEESCCSDHNDDWITNLIEMLNDNPSSSIGYNRRNQCYVSSTLTLLICACINAAVADACA